MVGFGAIVSSISAVTSPPDGQADEHVGPARASASVRRPSSARELAPCTVDALVAAVVDDAAESTSSDVLRRTPSSAEEAGAGDRRRARAADTTTFMSIRLPASSSALSSAAPEMIAVPC